jgi:hypothetical protein
VQLPSLFGVIRKQIRPQRSAKGRGSAASVPAQDADLCINSRMRLIGRGCVSFLSKSIRDWVPMTLSTLPTARSDGCRHAAPRNRRGRGSCKDFSHISRICLARFGQTATKIECHSNDIGRWRSWVIRAIFGRQSARPLLPQ